MFHSTKHAAIYQLTKFLKTRACESKSDSTHVSINDAAWRIPPEDLTQFYKLYSDAIQYFPLYIAEIVPQDIKPIFANFFFYPLSRPIDIDTITSIVKKIEWILTEIFGLKNDYTCIVSYKPSVRDNENDIEDFHILHFYFPYIVCEHIHHLILRRKFIEKYGDMYQSFDMKRQYLDICDCIENLDMVQPYLDSSHCIQNFDMEQVYLDSFDHIQYMYLSSAPGTHPYKILKIYNNDGLLARLQENIQMTVELLSLQNKNSLLIQPINGAKFYRYPVKTEIKDDCLPKINYDADIILKLLRMLKFREREDELIKISTILYYCHVTNTNENVNFYKIWEDWMQKMDHSVPMKIWEKCENYSYYYLTITNLYYYAHVDSPTLFEKIVNEDPSFKRYCSKN
jgi:hypothetical protein